jgi:hypothetical protein
VKNTFTIEEPDKYPANFSQTVLDENDVLQIIGDIKSNSAPGPSGIDGNYTKSLKKTQKNTLKKILLSAFNKILALP